MGWCGREQPPRHRNDCQSGEEWSRHFSFETASMLCPYGVEAVQRDAAGSLRVSVRNSLESLFHKEGLGLCGGQEVEDSVHPDRRPSQVPDLTLTLAAGFVHLYPPYDGAPYPSGRAEGRSPLHFVYPPRVGARGLKKVLGTTSDDHPPVHTGSLRGKASSRVFHTKARTTTPACR